MASSPSHLDTPQVFVRRRHTICGSLGRASICDETCWHSASGTVAGGRAPPGRLTTTVRWSGSARTPTSGNSTVSYRAVTVARALVVLARGAEYQPAAPGAAFGVSL